MAIITISRGTFSGGEALAHLVARQLGYPVVSREEIVDATDWFGIPVYVPGGDHKPLPSYWDRLTGEREAYMDSFRAALCERVNHGNLVYHGHAGHLLLPGVPVLRVRVVADADYRVSAVMRDQQLNRDEAIAYIKRVDAERMEWVRYLYGVEWDDSTLYDVVLNLSHLSLDSACSTVVHMARLDEFKLTPRALAALGDMATRSRVSAALARDVRTAGTSLKVEVKERAVTIAGNASKEVLNALPAVIAGIEGVGDVKFAVTVG